MDWRKIPSLSALRAFEATARLNSFSAAGRDLNVTHAAIAQHIRSLEDFFGQRLFLREGRGMQLTPAGHRLSASISEGFSLIANGVEALRREGEERALKIAITPTFAENWLMPRLGDFWSMHPEIKLALMPGTRLVDLVREDFDLAIRYGKGDWEGAEAELLVRANYIVVGTPDMVKGRKVSALKDIVGYPWVIDTHRDEQILWAREQGLDLAGERVSNFPTGGLVLSALRSGMGLSIQGRALVENEVAEGSLQAMFEETASQLGYYIIQRDRVPSANLRAFLKWLRSQA